MGDGENMNRTLVDIVVTGPFGGMILASPGFADYNCSIVARGDCRDDGHFL